MYLKLTWVPNKANCWVPSSEIHTHQAGLELRKLCFKQASPHPYPIWFLMQVIWGPGFEKQNHIEEDLTASHILPGISNQRVEGDSEAFVESFSGISALSFRAPLRQAARTLSGSRNLLPSRAVYTVCMARCGFSWTHLAASCSYYFVFSGDEMFFWTLTYLLWNELHCSNSVKKKTKSYTSALRGSSNQSEMLPAPGDLQPWKWSWILATGQKYQSVAGCSAFSRKNRICLLCFSVQGKWFFKMLLLFFLAWLL